MRGPVATGSEVTSRVPYVSKYALLEPNANRFLTFLTKVKGKTEPIYSTEYKVQERRPRGQSTTMGANALSGATTLTLVTTAHLSIGDLIVVPARAYQARVIAINSSTSIDVTPNLGTSASALTSGDAVNRLSRVENEGYTVGQSFMTDTTQTTNYISTISTPVEWTNYQTMDASYLSDDQKSNRIEEDEEAAAIEHMREIDRELLFSYKSKTTDGNNRNLLTTQGMIPSIVTNIYDHTGGVALTETQFNQLIVEPVWLNNGAATEKWLLAANRILTLFEGFGIGRLQFQEVKSRDLGFDINAYRTTRGTLNVFHAPQLDVPYYNESLVIVDPNFVKLAILKDTTYVTDLQPKNVKTKLNEWSTMLGLWQAYEEAHGFARDLRTAA